MSLGESFARPKKRRAVSGPTFGLRVMTRRGLLHTSSFHHTYGEKISGNMGRTFLRRTRGVDADL